MLTAGARDDTRVELCTFLEMKDQEILANDMHALLKNSQRYSCVNITQSLWLQKHITIADTWKTAIENKWMSSIHTLDFTKGNANEKIKQWISKASGDFLQPDLQLNPDTKVVLLNTIHMQLQWKTSFSENNTYEEAFYLENNTKMNIPFMHNQIKEIRYYEGDTYESICMPTSDGSQVYYFLPKDGHTLEESIHDTWLDTIQMDTGISTTVALSLPKFDIENQIDLLQACKDMGMQALFTKGQWLFDPPSNLNIHNIEQSTRIQMHEEGVEAATATHVEFRKSASIDATIPFVLNRPFFYVITTIDHIPIFMGTLQTP